MRKNLTVGQGCLSAISRSLAAARWHRACQPSGRARRGLLVDTDARPPPYRKRTGGPSGDVDARQYRSCRRSQGLHDKQVALIKRAASYPEVERIFVHPAIKKALCQVAGTDRKWLGKVRPFYGHYYHFHMRIKCPPGFAGCKPQTPPTGADGCGKEVDQWLARVVPAKTPAPRRRQSALLQSRQSALLQSRRSCSQSYLRNAKLFWGPNRTRSRYREMR